MRAKSRQSDSIYLNTGSDFDINGARSRLRECWRQTGTTPARRTAGQEFAIEARRAGRIRFGDVKRLQRDILPDGISSREEAELLLTLDQAVSRADRAFASWLAMMMVDYVIWGTRPTGSIDVDTGAWLAPFLAGQNTTKAMQRLAKELAAEAEQGGFTLPYSALNGASGDLVSTQAGVEPMPLAA